MNTKTNVEINDAVAFFGHQDDLIAAVVYQGDLHGAMPVEAHLDTGRGKLSMIFRNGATQFETDIVDLTPTNSLMAENEHKKFQTNYAGSFNSSATRPVEKIGFYAVNETGQYKVGELYNVPVLVIT